MNCALVEVSKKFVQDKSWLLCFDAINATIREELIEIIVELVDILMRDDRHGASER